MLTLQIASPQWLSWAQTQVTAHHYLHRPVDTRSSILAYIVRLQGVPLGCLMFGRPEAARCYDGGLTYGSVEDLAAGRAAYSRWEVLNLARVWLDPRLQAGGELHVPNAATQVVAAALRRVVYDYLTHFPPCFLDEPWRLRRVLSYCDTRIHRGTIYRAAGFELARTNADGIQTWHRPLRQLQTHERRAIEQCALYSYRSKMHRARRQIQHMQMELDELKSVLGEAA